MDTAVADAVKSLAAQSDRPEASQGITLTPLDRRREGDTTRYSSARVDIDRAGRRATIAVLGPDGDPPADAGAMQALGAAFWPLRLARELDDALLDLRANARDIGTLVFTSQGDIARVLAYDAFLDANRDHWLAREILNYWKRTLKRTISRHDRSSRASSRAGTLAGSSHATVVHADRRRRATTQSGAGDVAAQFGDYPMSNGYAPATCPWRAGERRSRAGEHRHT